MVTVIDPINVSAEEQLQVDSPLGLHTDHHLSLILITSGAAY